jgi:hypothetical protein
MRCQFSGKNLDDGYVSLDGRVVPMNDTFRYLGSMLQSEGDKHLVFFVTRRSKTN